MKTAKDFMEEANAVVPKMGPEDAIAKYNAGGGVFAGLPGVLELPAVGRPGVDGPLLLVVG